MANQYLVEIHDFISTQMALGQEARREARARGDDRSVKFYEGRLDELKKLRVFVSDHFDLDTQVYY